MCVCARQAGCAVKADGVEVEVFGLMAGKTNHAI